MSLFGQVSHSGGLPFEANNSGWFYSDVKDLRLFRWNSPGVQELHSLRRNAVIHEYNAQYAQSRYISSCSPSHIGLLILEHRTPAGYHIAAP